MIILIMLCGTVNCALAPLLPNFSYGHDVSYRALTLPFCLLFQLKSFMLNIQKKLKIIKFNIYLINRIFFNLLVFHFLYISIF